MQKRWIAGSFYFIAFMIPFIYLPSYVLYHLFSNLRNVMTWNDPGGGKTLDPISFGKIGVAFLLSILVFVAGLFDTYFADERKRKKNSALTAATDATPDQ